MKNWMKRVFSTGLVLWIVVFALLFDTVLPSVEDSNLISEAAFAVTTTTSSPKLSYTSLRLLKGSKFTLKMTGTTKTVQWKSSNQSVAAVSSKGVVTAKKKGTATITAVVSGKKYTCKVTVNNTLGVNCQSVTLKEDSKAIKVTFTCSNASVYCTVADTRVVSCHWSQKWSSNTTTLYLEPVAGGTTSIKIYNEANKEYVTLQVTVTVPITLTSTNLTLVVGEQAVLPVEVLSDRTIPKVSWKSSNSAVASVKNGEVTALKVGEAVITATSGDLSKTCKITVIEPLTLALPELPQQICEYQEDQLICSYTLQKVSYISVYDSISGEYHLTLRIEGTKDYDARGSNVNTYAMIGWKLYNAADEEVDSGVCYGLMAAAGKKFTSEDAVLKLKPGAYHLALLEIA